MLKRFLAACLALSILFSLAACTPDNNVNNDPTEPTEVSFHAEKPEMVREVYQIYTPNHLLYMAVEPNAKYALCNNIDMKGTTWTPIDDFTGSFSGKLSTVWNFTISNVVIEVGEGDTNVGFFRKVTGSVENVYFDNVTLTGTGVFSGNAGIVVGEAATTLEGIQVRNSSLELTVKDANVGVLAGKTAANTKSCYTAGTMKVTLAGGKNYVSGGIGYAEKELKSVESHVNLTVTESEKGSGAVGGLVGYSKSAVSDCTYGGHFKVDADAATGAGAIVGELVSVMKNTANCARTNVVNGQAVTDHVGILASGAQVNNCFYRDLSNIEETYNEEEFAMRKLMVDYMYQMVSVVWRPRVDITSACVSHKTCQNVYLAGVAYVGLPYTHEGGCVETMLTCLDENGYLIEGLEDTRWEGMFGNDCLDAVAWCFAQTSSSFTFFDTSMAVGVCGSVPVGDYHMFNTPSTKNIWNENGYQKMYEALAQVKMGDGILTRTETAGHARMAAESAYVFRNADGSINPDKSYIICHEQGKGGDLAERKSACAIYQKYYFSSLGASGYIPFATAEIVAGKPAEVEISCTNTKFDKSGVATGTINSSHRIIRVSVAITDANGASVYNKVIYPFGGRDECKTVAMRNEFYKDFTKLSLDSGKQYHYEVKVFAAGEEVTVQNFDFTA